MTVAVAGAWDCMAKAPMAPPESPLVLVVAPPMEAVDQVAPMDQATVDYTAEAADQEEATMFLSKAVAVVCASYGDPIVLSPVPTQVICDLNRSGTQ